MIVLLRFVGVMNAAVWFGAAVFFFLGISPATYSENLKLLFKGNFDFYSVITDQVYWKHYLALQISCGAVAIAHQLTEWLYLGRRLQRPAFWVVVGVLVLAMADGLWLQPKLLRLHEIKFSVQKTPQGYQVTNEYPMEQRVKATNTLQVWERVASITSLGLKPGQFFLTANWVVVVALGILLWRLANPVDTPRFIPANKFRS